MHEVVVAAHASDWLVTISYGGGGGGGGGMDFLHMYVIFTFK